ncbi:MAG: hypothetical protein IE880_04145 [Epsilonproteobacteria bacterium]|nr:hypothetical protein [Campylobacterota bacterium]
MKKSTVILSTIVAMISLSHAEDNDLKSWSIELGYQTSIQKINDNFDVTYKDGSSSSRLGSGLTDNLYIDLGRNIFVGDKYLLLPSIGFTQATLLVDDYHNDELNIKLPLFYKTEWLNQQILVGPQVKFIFYPALNYNHREGQVDMNYQTAFAYGIQTLWGRGVTKLSVGLDYLTSAHYTAIQYNADTVLEADVNMNGLYMNVGLHLDF